MNILSVILVALLSLTFQDGARLATDQIGATSATITGRVTAEPDNAPVANASVTPIDSTNTALTSVFADASGRYTVTVAAGDYKMKFSYSDGLHIAGYYNHKLTQADAEIIHVTAGAHLSGIDGSLPLGGQIHGVVSAAQAGQSIMATEVIVYDAQDQQLTFALVDAGGAYSVTGLATGAYKLLFRPYPSPYLVPEYYNDKATLAEANAISVTAGSVVTAINASLALGGQISGTISLLPGNGDSGIFQIMALRANGEVVATAESLGPGYALPNLPAGVYRVYFATGYDGYPMDYAPQFYHQAAKLEAAAVVTVTAGQTTPNIDATLARRNIIMSLASSTGVTNGLALLYRGALAPILSDDGGASWQMLETIPWQDGQFAPTLVALAPRGDSTFPTRLLVAVNGGDALMGIYRTGDTGKSWTHFVPPLTCYLGEQYYQELKVSPADPTHLYLVVYCPESELGGRTHLFASLDAGVNWQEIAEAYSVVPSPLDALQVYYNHLGEWQDGGIPKNFPVDWLALDAVSSQKLYGVDQDVNPG
jgi:hypothetical protein